MRPKNMALIIVFLGIYLTGSLVYGQGDTSIYLLNIKIKDGHYRFDGLKKITDRKGYNNQPHFLPDGNSIFYSSALEKQTEIFRYDIAVNKRIRITNNNISEYSPTPMPDGTHFSAVQLYVEEGPDKGAQPLVVFPLGGGTATDIYRGDKKVGYHAWMGPGKLALFVLGAPHSLQFYDVKLKTFQEIAKNIGRCIQVVPGLKKVSFTQMKGKVTEIIKLVDFEGKKIRDIYPVIKPGDYFKWVSSDEIITASGSRLYRFKVGEDKGWRELKNFTKLGLKNISRIAFSKKGNLLAVVSGD